MSVIAITQARMGSTRLPGKVLCDLAGMPMLKRHVRRAARAATIDVLVVATTSLPGDNPIAELCASEGWNCFRGSEHDLLDRYYQAARQYGADIVVRVTSDCPLIDPQLIDQVVAVLKQDSRLAYACNFADRRTFPRGLDVEACTFAALERAWREDQNAAWREHVTEYMLHYPEHFPQMTVHAEADYSTLRWTVDTPEDLELARRIYGHFLHDQFTWREALALIEAHPDWRLLNHHIVQKVVQA